MLLLLLTAVFAILVPPPETSLSSATHALSGHSDAPSAPKENSAGSAAAGESDKVKEAAQANLDEKVPGPGAFLGALLRRMAAASNESETGIKKLIAGLPHVLPDLNKVLVAL